MKRFAAHYLFLPGNHLYKQHWVELDDGRFRGIYPLEREVAFTTFSAGVILVVPSGAFRSAEELSEIIATLREKFPENTFPELFARLPVEEIAEGDTVNLYHLDGINLLSAKFRANDGSGCGHIQRLG